MGVRLEVCADAPKEASSVFRQSPGASGTVSRRYILSADPSTDGDPGAQGGVPLVKAGHRMVRPLPGECHMIDRPFVRERRGDAHDAVTPILTVVEWSISQTQGRSLVSPWGSSLASTMTMWPTRCNRGPSAVRSIACGPRPMHRVLQRITSVAQPAYESLRLPRISDVMYTY